MHTVTMTCTAKKQSVPSQKLIVLKELLLLLLLPTVLFNDRNETLLQARAFPPKPCICTREMSSSFLPI